MTKKTLFIGLMLFLGATPLTMVDALGNGCIEPDPIHTYAFAATVTIHEDKANDDTLFQYGYAGVTDLDSEGCEVTFNAEGVGEVHPPGHVSDAEFGIGAAKLQVVTVPSCDGGALGQGIGQGLGHSLGHHNVNFYVSDLLGDLDNGLKDVVSGTVGADGAHPGNPANPADPPAPCGNGIIAPEHEPEDCGTPFWGKGPHTTCGIGADGSYWVFIDNVGADLAEPRAGLGIAGCIWTAETGGKEVKPCLKTV